MRRSVQVVACSTLAIAPLLVFAGSTGEPAKDPFTPAQRKYWAFQPVKRVEPPVVKHTDRVVNPIDVFIASKLEPKQMGLNPEADRVTLLRRVSFDLIGLPPTLEEIDAFVNDKTPQAYEKVVDRLLASPHYGE